MSEVAFIDPISGSEIANRRSERRLRVLLPLDVRGRDRNGVTFEERTYSEDVCRGGMAFVLTRSMEAGMSLEIHLPLPSPAGKKGQTDFATRGQVRHVKVGKSGTVIGVVFIGPRLHRIFASESPRPS